MNLFSHCILTASDEPQAQAFRALLARRVDHGLYPREISFHVYPDPPGRVGSGAGTLWALHKLYEEIGYDPLGDNVGAAAPSALVLHAAGESRRLPVFAPEGKLFAPVPVPSSSVLPPVVLDLQLALYLSFPWKPGQVVVGSGDVIIDFDTTALLDFEAPITGFATPAPIEQGSRHGVFKFDPHLRSLEDYFQKQPPDYLREHALIEGTDACALDIGIVAMSHDYVGRFFRLANARSDSGRTFLEDIAAGDLRFGLYLEQLSASLGTVDVADYKRRLAGASTLSEADQELFFSELHGLPLGGHLARKCTFLHFGSVREFPAAAAAVAESGLKPFYALFDTEELSPDRSGGALVENSVACSLSRTASSETAALVDSSENAAIEVAGVFLVNGLSAPLPAALPDGFCVDERSVDRDGPEHRVVATYHASDSFRPEALETLRYAGGLLLDWVAARDLTPADLGLEGTKVDASVDLYDIPLFPLDPSDELLAGFLTVPPAPTAWAAHFRAAKRLSLRELNRSSDLLRRDKRRTRLRSQRLAEQLAAGRGWRTAPARDVAQALAADAAPEGPDPGAAGTAPRDGSGNGERAGLNRGAALSDLAKIAAGTADPVLKFYRNATLRAAGYDGAVDVDPRGALHFIPEGHWHAAKRAVKADQIVWARSPVRLDLAGGWTDTPPYTNLFGGAVTNVAVNLNGQPPIQVFVRPVADPVIIFHSIDLGEREEIRSASGLNAYTDPSAKFALPRAACTLLGLGTDRDLQAQLQALGGGFEISLLAAVPKGSGLGTSSVLGGVILAALFRFFGLSSTPEDLFLSVLELEQMLTTGGGWQDQIGGLAGGVKYIETRPGSNPRALVHQLDPHLFEEPELKSRMTLYYTGVTRLAKNILQEVVGRVNEREPAFLFTHEYLRSLALQARSAIALRDFDALARIVRGSWRANRLIHESTTNPEIDSLLAQTATNYEAVKLLGAGGGGYALFLSKDPDQADALRERLASISSASAASRLVAFDLSRAGLQVSVS